MRQRGGCHGQKPDHQQRETKVRTQAYWPSLSHVLALRELFGKNERIRADMTSVNFSLNEVPAHDGIGEAFGEHTEEEIFLPLIGMRSIESLRAHRLSSPEGV